MYAAVLAARFWQEPDSCCCLGKDGRGGLSNSNHSTPAGSKLYKLIIPASETLKDFQTCECGDYGYRAGIDATDVEVRQAGLE